MSLAHSTSGGLPQRCGRSAPALRVSRSARRSLTLWPACLLTPLRSLFPECFSPSRYLLEPLQVLPVGATSYRAGFAPARINMPFHGTHTFSAQASKKLGADTNFSKPFRGMQQILSELGTLSFSVVLVRREVLPTDDKSP